MVSNPNCEFVRIDYGINDAQYHYTGLYTNVFKYYSLRVQKNRI